MRHLSEGTLRRIYDEPLALTAEEQEHFDRCAECRARFDGAASLARATAGWLEMPALQADPALALGAFRSRLVTEARRPLPWYQRLIDRTGPRLRPLATPVLATALAAVFVTGVAVTGVSGELARVFQPTKVVAVPVSPSAFRDTARIVLDYGQLKWLPSPPQPQVLADRATAQQLTGLRVLMPGSLPQGVSGAVTYGVVTQATGSLTFDAAKLSASSAKTGVRVSPMPSTINGSTLVVTAGPALVEAWGVSDSGLGSAPPTLVIAQTRVPTVDSTGASATQLEDYLLSQPGVPPELKAQIEAIKNPTSTLPIPVPTGLVTTEQVQVNGAQGVLIKAGFGAGVVWVSNGVIYAVGGQLTPDQVLAIASSLR
jgi:hypothetical protein